MKLVIHASKVFLGYAGSWSWSVWLDDEVIHSFDGAFRPSNGAVRVGSWDTWEEAFANGCRAYRIVNMRFLAHGNGLITIVHDSEDESDRW